MVGPPIWKNMLARQIGSFPQVWVWNKKHLKPPPRNWFCTIFNITSTQLFTMATETFANSDLGVVPWCKHVIGVLLWTCDSENLYAKLYMYYVSPHIFLNKLLLSLRKLSVTSYLLPNVLIFSKTLLQQWVQSRKARSTANLKCEGYPLPKFLTAIAAENAWLQNTFSFWVCLFSGLNC